MEADQMNYFKLLCFLTIGFTACGCSGDGAPSNPKPADPSKAPVLKQLKEGTPAAKNTQ